MTAASGAQRETLLGVVDDAHRFLRRQLDTSWVPDYLASRRLQVVECVGYATTGWTGMLDHLRSLGYRDESIRDAGVAVTTQRGTLVDRFRDRVTLAVRDSEGDVVGFIARKHPSNTDPRAPRYVNSPASDHFRKGELLFGLADNLDALRQGAEPVLVEGPFDALAVTQASRGACIGIAPGGTALTRAQVSALADVCAGPEARTFIAMDADSAGRRAAEAAGRLLDDVRLHPVNLQLASGGDPASLHQTGELEQVLEDRPRESDALSRVLTVIRHAAIEDDGNAQAEALRRAAGLIALATPAEVARAVPLAAEALQLPVEVLNRHVIDAVINRTVGHGR